MAEGPRGDETLGAPTAAQDRQGEDRQGRGEGDETPPTTRATRRQGADSGDSALRGKQRTAEPPTTMETAEKDSSAGPPPAQSDGADGTRSEHGALTRREYD